ncbi:MAG: hypothetical protein AB7Y46_02705 [Armatimonadota bacterium]
MAGPGRTALLCLIALCAAGALVAADGFEQRYLWTWDHRMDWSGRTPGGVVMGGGSYTKSADEFLDDYRRLIDYVHEHTSFNAIIIWGFLRDAHGGVEAARQLCDYANARGVRIIPGVGTSGYEGYYFQGKHQYNVTTWLRQHPELRATGADGNPRNALCPSKPANVQWLQDGCRWLFETFEIGGINFEIGDFFVCHCDDCRAARAAIPGEAEDYYKDMAISTAPVARLAHEIAPDAWLSYATYTGFTPEMAAQPPAWVELIPEQIICQWTLTGMVSDAAWPDGLRPPTARNIGYLHWGNKSTKTVHGFFTAHIRDVCRRAADAGFLGLVTYGEDPASIITMRLFYEAWSFFLDDPHATLDDFAAGPLATWFASAPDAREFLRIALDLEQRGVTRSALPDALAAATAARAAAPQAQARETWDEFLAYLQERLAEIEAADRVIEDPAEVAAAMAEGFRVPQETSTTLVLPRDDADTLELLVRAHYPMENGLLPVMRLRFNGELLGPERALDRPALIRTPFHESYGSLAAFDEEAGAWRVKYDTDFEVSESAGGEYDTLDYSPTFRFDLSGLWREGRNELRIENLERRFRPSEMGVLVVGRVRLE